MRAADVVGKRIKAVHQTRHYDGQLAQTVVSLDSIELEDGTLIFVYGHDDSYDLYVTADVSKRRKKSLDFHSRKAHD